jgi:hypothetical protein
LVVISGSAGCSAWRRSTAQFRGFMSSFLPDAVSAAPPEPVRSACPPERRSFQIDHFVMAITSAEAILWHTTPRKWLELPHLADEPAEAAVPQFQRTMHTHAVGADCAIQTVPGPDECYPLPRRPPRCRLRHARWPASAGGSYHVRRNRADRGIS